jgi:hypothetical protein
VQQRHRYITRQDLDPTTRAQGCVLFLPGMIGSPAAQNLTRKTGRTYIRDAASKAPFCVAAWMTWLSCRMAVCQPPVLPLTVLLKRRRSPREP